MNDRLRTVLLGLAVGLVPLLLLDLARILGDAVRRDPVATSRWWVIACYLAAGAVAAAGVAAGRRDRFVPLIGLLVVALFTLPALPLGWSFPALPLSPTDPGGEAIALTLVGVYAYAAVRGPGR